MLLSQLSALQNQIHPFLFRITYGNISFCNQNVINFENKNFQSVSEQYYSHHLLLAVLEISFKVWIRELADAY